MIESRASGSTFKEISGSAMKKIPALIPVHGLLNDFEVLCQSHFELQEKSEKENETLASIRDALLPKLMSGEIRVPYEEEVI